MNSENSKTSDSHRLLLNLWDKINLMKSDKYVVKSDLSINYTCKIKKKSSENKNVFIYNYQHGMVDLNFLMNHIL